MPTHASIRTKIGNLLARVACNCLRKKDFEPPPFLTVLLPRLDFLYEKSCARVEEWQIQIRPQCVIEKLVLEGYRYQTEITNYQ